MKASGVHFPLPHPLPPSSSGIQTVIPSPCPPKPQIDFILADVRHLSHQLPRLRADVVIMNPPFGTKLKGADMAFLRAAFSVATTSVYSLHKSSTREFIAKTAKRDLGASSAEVLAMLRYDLPPTMKFHR
ncbi:hypothetical protein Vretifemale_6291 [Volvox reticuliferus]|nr:hypothetical protein Vretifemale_6291 [Volvox reticuliferus]